MIYHLALESDWTHAEAGAGEYRISTIGRQLADVGFIHCSFDHQVQTVANAFYRGRADVLLLSIDESKLMSEIREEKAAGTTDVFPHIYGPLNIDAVASVRPLALASDGTLSIVV